MSLIIFKIRFPTVFSLEKDFREKNCLKGLYEVLLSNYDEINDIMDANKEPLESNEETLLKICDQAEKGGGISECPNVRILHKILFTIIE